MADSNPLNTPGLPNLKQEDLKDPSLSVLNSNIRTIWGKIVSLSGGAGDINLKSKVIATDLQIPSQSVPPTDPNTVLTLGSAMQLFTPQNVRGTSIQNSFPNNNTGSAVSGGSPTPTPTPTPSGSGGDPINAICDGTSLTRGNYVVTPPPTLWGDWQSYPGQLQTQLPCVVSNIAVDGATSTSLLASHFTSGVVINLYDDTRFNVYNLEIGVNDLWAYSHLTYPTIATQLATLKTNVIAIVSAAQAAGYAVVVATIFNSQYSGIPIQDDFNAAILNYNTWLLNGTLQAALPGGSPNVYIADVAGDPLLFDPSNSEFFQSDNLHLFPAGYGVMARNFAAAIQLSSMYWDPYHQANVTPGTFVQNTYLKAGESISVNDFGASYAATASQNTTAILAAIAAGQASGRSVRFPDAYYNVHKFNVCDPTIKGSYPARNNLQGLRLWSDSNYSTSLGPATLLICDGGGTSWLKACVNVVAPNAGNTGPLNPFVGSVYGMQIEGLYVQQTAGIGVGSLGGFWLVTNFNFTVNNCGVIKPPNPGRWSYGINTWQCGVNGNIRNFSADTCATGISLNGAIADPITSYTEDILVENPGTTSCTSAGVSLQYSNHCRIIGGYYIGNAVGVYGNGLENTVEGGYFASSTSSDIDMLTAVAPWVTPTAAGSFTVGQNYQIVTLGGSPNFTAIGASANTVGVQFKATGVGSGTGTASVTVVPDRQRIFANTFSSQVNIRNSTGTTLCANSFNSGSSLLIDSVCSQTYVLQHNSFPATAFVDNGALTYLASVVIGTGATGLISGMMGQWYYRSSTSTLYLCTVSGLAGSATWKAIINATTLILAFRQVIASTGPITSSDFMVQTKYTLGNTTLTLPAASSVTAGQMFSFANYNTTAGNLVTISPAGADKINNTAASITMSALGTDVLMSDGVSNWILFSYSVVVQAGTGTGGSPVTANGITVNIVGNGVYISNAGLLSASASGGLSAITTSGAVAIAPPGAWTAWTPTLTVTNQTASSSSIVYSRYTQLGKMVTFEFEATYIISVGGSAASFDFTLPTTPGAKNNTGGSFAASIFSAALASTVPAAGGIYGTTVKASVGLQLSGVTTYTIWGGGSYEVA